MSTAAVLPAVEGAAPAKGKGKLIVILAVVVALLAGGGGAAWFFQHKAAAAEGDAGKPAEKAKTAKPVFVTLENFTVNLAGGDHFMQLGLVVQVKDDETAEKIKAYLPLIRNKILLLLSARRADPAAGVRPGRITSALALLGFGFLLAPLVLVAVMSVSNDPYLNFPPSGWSFRWYAALADNAAILAAARTSAVLAGIVTVLALLAGIPAAYAVARGAAPPGVALALSAPLLLPTLVIGLALLFVLQPLGLVATWHGLALAHLAVVLPFVVRLMTTAFQGLAADLAEAGATLGAAPWRCFAWIILPLALPGIAASAALAFLVSFDETVISLFLVGPRLTTLPIALFRYTESRSDPLVAALAVVLILLSAMAVLAVDRLVGFTRSMGRA